MYLSTAKRRAVSALGYVQQLSRRVEAVRSTVREGITFLSTKLVHAYIYIYIYNDSGPFLLTAVVVLDTL